LRQMSFLHLFGASCGVPPFFACILCLCVSSAVPAWAAGDVITYLVANSSYAATRDALVEVIEGEGLVVGAILPFNQMLQGTGHKGAMTPFREAEIVQFCSGALAWQMVQEAVEQLAVCPLSIALYSRVGTAEIMLAYRSPGDGTPSRRQASELLRRITARAAELARFGWTVAPVQLR